MKKYYFPFATDELTIDTRGVVDTDVLDAISNILNKVEPDLNHKIQNSSAYSFNEARPGIETRVSKEFIIFLDTNANYAFHNPQSFKPFIYDLKKHGDKPDALLDSYTADEDVELVTKNFNIMLDSSKLRTEFIMDMVAEYLLYKNIDSFLIKYKDKFISKGRPRLINFNIEDKKIYKTHLFNQASAMNYNYNMSNPNQNAGGFASNYKMHINKFSITKNSSMVENKVMASYFEVINTKKEYLFFAKKWKTDIAVVYQNDEVEYFKAS